MQDILTPSLQRMHQRLGITPEMLTDCGMPVYAEATDLIDAGQDMFDRPCQMTAVTFQAWQEMSNAAVKDGIGLRVVSAYRSSEYQCELIKRKIADGRTIEEILKVNAPPGCSEHHTGRALDLHAGDLPALTEAFGESSAFAWLSQNASRFNFFMSYPRDNPWGIDYEPWHWCYLEVQP